MGARAATAFALFALSAGCVSSSRAPSEPRDITNAPRSAPRDDIDPGASCSVRISGDYVAGVVTFDDGGRPRVEEWHSDGYGCVLRRRYRHDEGGHVLELAIDHQCPGHAPLASEQPLLARDSQLVRWRRDAQGRPLEVDIEFGVEVRDTAGADLFAPPGGRPPVETGRDAFALLCKPPPLPPAHVERAHARVQYTYDAAGRVASMRHRTELPKALADKSSNTGDRTETWAYGDARTVSRTIEFDAKPPGYALKRFDYGLDESGRVTSVVEVGADCPPANVTRTRYTYDPDGRLVDEDYELPCSSSPLTKKRFAYASRDANDPRLKRAYDAVPPTSPAPAPGHEFDYLPDGRLASVTNYLRVSDADKDKPPETQTREKFVTTYRYAGTCRAPLRGLTPTVSSFVLDPWRELKEGNPLSPVGHQRSLHEPPFGLLWR